MKTVKLSELLNAHNLGQEDIEGIPLSEFRNALGQPFDHGLQKIDSKKDDEYSAEEYLTIPQAVKYLAEQSEEEVLPNTLRKMCIADRVPGARKIGRDWVIPWLKMKEVKIAKRGWPAGKARKKSS